MLFSISLQQSVVMAGFDPRFEDMKAVKQMYDDVFKPYISSASSWVSGMYFYMYVHVARWFVCSWVSGMYFYIPYNGKIWRVLYWRMSRLNVIGGF